MEGRRGRASRCVHVKIVRRQRREGMKGEDVDGLKSKEGGKEGGGCRWIEEKGGREGRGRIENRGKGRRCMSICTYLRVGEAIDGIKNLLPDNL